LGGTSDYDGPLIKTQGNVNSLRAVHDAMKAKAASLKFTKTFFLGDSEPNAKEFDGLEKRLTGDQVLAQGSTCGGDALTLAKLDELLDAVVGGADCLFMNKRLRRKISELVRAAGQATETVSMLRRQLWLSARCPSWWSRRREPRADILDFTRQGGGDRRSTPSTRALRGRRSTFRQSVRDWMSWIWVYAGGWLPDLDRMDMRHGPSFTKSGAGFAASRNA
jgi:hypothetical protein